MMKKILLLFLALGLSTLTSAQEKLHLNGKLKGLTEDAKLSLSSGNEEIEFQAKDGKFNVEMQLSEAPTSIYLYVEQVGDSYYTSFFVGNESITIDGSISDFPHNIEAMGSQYDGVRYQNYVINKKFNDEIEQLQVEAQNLMQKGISSDSIALAYYSNVEPLGKVQKILKQVEENDYEFLKQYVNTAYGRFMLPFTMESYTTEQMKTLLDLVELQYKNTKEVEFSQTLIDYKTLEVGDKYYNFTALTREGQTVQFSDYFKGKYVLLDFSTMHCGYCQRAAPQTAKVADELSAKMDYVTYYVDNFPVTMDMYYELKGNKGVLLWNKKGRLDLAIAKYKQRGTPHYVLFDPEGNFVNVLEGYTEDFGDILKEWMQ
ncbi:TlpA family protein disulfide reductase [Myroides fluvii]|uniref:TlpA family protein disulfide reductase n=1 Tax=Myroides fluvii TaxID=2572594 RepID=UPI00131D4A69|nr:redoxin domain-containing protein [Myroides fluvii]